MHVIVEFFSLLSIVMKLLYGKITVTDLLIKFYLASQLHSIASPRDLMIKSPSI
jgi:hypothetical protein